QIPTSEELLGRLQKMTDAYQDRLEEAERAQKEAAGRAEEAERAQREASGQLSALRSRLAERILRRLAERGLAVTDAQRAQVIARDDDNRLLDWLERAASAPTTGDALS